MQLRLAMMLVTQISAVKERLAQTDGVNAREVPTEEKETGVPTEAEGETGIEALIVVAAIAIAALIADGGIGAVTVTDAEVLVAEARIEEMVVTGKEAGTAVPIAVDVIAPEVQVVKSLLKSAARSCVDSVKSTTSPKISVPFLLASLPRRPQRTI
jgi:hypothetical protein